MVKMIEKIKNLNKPTLICGIIGLFYAIFSLILFITNYNLSTTKLYLKILSFPLLLIALCINWLDNLIMSFELIEFFTKENTYGIIIFIIVVFLIFISLGILINLVIKAIKKIKNMEKWKITLIVIFIISLVVLCVYLQKKKTELIRLRGDIVPEGYKQIGIDLIKKEHPEIIEKFGPNPSYVIWVPKRLNKIQLSYFSSGFGIPERPIVWIIIDVKKEKIISVKKMWWD